MVKVCVASRARGMMAAMLEDARSTTHDASPADAGESVLDLRKMLGRMQAELHFERTRNAALNVEVARLKRWRLRSGGPVPR